MIESIFFNPWVWILPTILLLILIIIGLIFAFANDAIAVVPLGIIFLIGAGIYFIAILPPYDVSYYQTYRVTGELASLEKAFTGDEGGTMSQTFVATVDGVDLFIRSDDQRFRSLAVGDEVYLNCGKVFQYFVEPYYDCNFGGVK